VTTRRPAAASLQGQVSLLQTFADPTRLRLLALLADEHELSVGELTTVTGLAQSRVSTHLGRLRAAGLLIDRKLGASTFYALGAAAAPGRVRELWELVRGSLGDRLLESDRRRRDELLGARTAPAASLADELERHHAPGRTWEATALGLLGLVELGDVLDVGAGSGAVAELLVPRARRVTLLDRSERAVEAAQRRFQGRPNVEVVLGDMHRLPFGAAEFEHVLLLHVLVHSEEPHVVVAEAARVLKPGGRLSLVTLAEHEPGLVAESHEHRTNGFAVGTLRDLLRAARLDVEVCELTSRGRREPHFEVLSAFARKSPLAPRLTG
jgi:ArsR family transcriptional regulator